jgi:predicted ATP-grasp superfamily ATP-dependent carboligase
MVVQALLRDLHQVPGVDVITVGSPVACRRQLTASIQAADAVWPLTAASSGMLERLSRQVLQHERILLGSRPRALRVAASRLRTSRVLARAGIDVVATYAPGQPLPARRGAWIVRPDDGAHVDDTRIFPSTVEALAWINTSASRGYVLQPYIPGKLGSLSLLCCDGSAQLLGCNEQRVVARDNQLHYLGTTVNSWPDRDGAFARLAQRIAAALPGLWGHAGVDFVQADRSIVVLAINAGMNASYAGLHASLGHNPAALVLNLLAPPPHALLPRVQPLSVSVDVAAFDSG